MILLGNQIERNVKEGKILFDGNIENIGPNSVDITLHEKLKTYIPCKIIEIEFEGKKYKKIVEDTNKLPHNFFISMKNNNKVYEYDIPDDGLILSPNILYLGATNERAGSDDFIAMYEGRSSTARLGFQSHLSAGFGDISFKSNWTLEIIVIHPLQIFKNVRVGQVYFHEVDEKSKIELFKQNKQYSSKGKYDKQIIAQESKMYLDFLKK
jgi:dCTP deaminase